jgi:hypothetical protein
MKISPTNSSVNRTQRATIHSLRMRPSQGRFQTHQKGPHKLASKLSSPLMDDVEPTKAADAADGGSEQTAAIADSSKTARAELAWSAAAAEEEEGRVLSEKGSRELWLGPVMALLAAAIAVASAVLFYVNRTPAPQAPAPPSASTRSGGPPTSTQTTSAVAVALPKLPPSYAGLTGRCAGTCGRDEQDHHQRDQTIALRPSRWRRRVRVVWVHFSPTAPGFLSWIW